MIGTTVYTVERVGVYRQGLIGVFPDEAAARRAAEAATVKKPTDTTFSNDSDGYHKFEVWRHVVGVTGEGDLVATWSARWDPWGRTDLERGFRWIDAP